jgi:hypothetical protein
MSQGRRIALLAVVVILLVAAVVFVGLAVIGNRAAGG